MKAGIVSPGAAGAGQPLNLAIVVYEIDWEEAHGIPRIVEIRQDPLNGAVFGFETGPVPEAKIRRSNDDEGVAYILSSAIAARLNAAPKGAPVSPYAGYVMVMDRESAATIRGWPQRILLRAQNEERADLEILGSTPGIEAFHLNRAIDPLLLRLERKPDDRAAGSPVAMRVIRCRVDVPAEAYLDAFGPEPAIFVCPLVIRPEWQGPAPAGIAAAGFADEAYFMRRFEVERLFWGAFAGTLDDPFIMQAPLIINRDDTHRNDADRAGTDRGGADWRSRTHSQGPPEIRFGNDEGDMGRLGSLMEAAISVFAPHLSAEDRDDMLSGSYDLFSVVAAFEEPDGSLRPPMVDQYYGSRVISRLVALIEEIVRILEPVGAAWAGPAGARASRSGLEPPRLWYEITEAAIEPSAHGTIEATARLQDFLMAHGRSPARIAELMP